jgi:hypothetical protein
MQPATAASLEMLDVLDTSLNAYEVVEDARNAKSLDR